jgi:hypothetical protein
LFKQRCRFIYMNFSVKTIILFRIFLIFFLNCYFNSCQNRSTMILSHITCHIIFQAKTVGSNINCRYAVRRIYWKAKSIYSPYSKQLFAVQFIRFIYMNFSVKTIIYFEIKYCSSLNVEKQTWSQVRSNSSYFHYILRFADK